MHPIVTLKGSLRTFILTVFALFWLTGLPGNTAFASSNYNAGPAYNFASSLRAFLKWHPNAPVVRTTAGAAAGPLWSFADQQTQTIFGGCLLCTVENPTAAIDGDTTTSSRLVLAAGVVGGIGQRLKFPGSYLAGDNIALDLEIPGAFYTKQLLSALKVKTYNANVSNNDDTNLDNSLIRIQVLGLGLGSTNKFRVIIPVTKNFDEVEVSLSALVAELGSVRIYEAAAFIPVTVAKPANVTTGTTASMTASLPRIPGTTFKWFTTPTGGTPLSTTNSLTTPELYRTTTYYVEASTGTPGLQSYVRTPVVLKVSGGDGPLWSYAAEEESPKTGGIACALCFVDNPEKAVDGDTTTASKIVLPAGILTSVGQLLKFSGNYKAGDNVAFDLEIPNKVYTKQVLSGIEIESYNNGISNSDRVAIGTSLFRLQALGVGPGGISKFRVIVPIKKDFNAVLVSLSALFAEFGALNVYEATAFVPVKATPDSANIANGQTASFTGSISPRLSTPIFRWFTQPKGGTPVFIGATFNTPALTKDTTYYLEAATSNGLTSFVRTPVPVNVGKAAGPLWTFATDEESPITGGLACALCFVDSARNAVDLDSSTASRIVLPAGIATTVGQMLKFPGFYKAGDQISLDLEIPNKLYTKQALSGIQIETFNNGVSNQDVTTIGTSLIRLQALGLGVGGIKKFRVILSVKKDFDAVLVSLGALFAEFGALKIYDATAFVPVKVTPDSANITFGQPATFTASIDPRMVNPTFKWYSSPNGGTPLFTGATLTTAPLFKDTAFYVEASTPNGLNSFVRVPVNVKVGKGAGTLWSFAGKEISPRTGGLACALCFVDSARNAVDGDTATASKLVLPVGVATYIGQLLEFPGYYKAGDLVSLDLEIPDKLYTKQALSGIQIESFNNGVANNDITTIGTSLIRLQALGLGVGGIRKFRVIFPVNKDFDGVEVRLSALFAEFGALKIYEAAAMIPVNVEPDSATITRGGTVTFSGNIDRVPGATINWYSAPTGGTPLATGPSFTSPPLNKSTTYYAEASAPGGLKSFVRVPAPVKVSGGIGPIWSYADQEESPVTGGVACALCFVDSPYFAIDGDTTTASKIVLPVGLLTSVGQRLKFPGGYKAGDGIALDLQIPNVLYTKQLLSAVKVRTLNKGVDNNDPVTLNSSLIRLQALGLGIGASPKFRVIIPSIPHDFDEVQVDLSAVFAEFGSLRVYEATAFIPVSVNPPAPVVPSGGTTTLSASIDPDRVISPTFKWYTTPSGGTPVFTGQPFTTPPLSRTTTYYVEAFAPNDNLNSYIRTPVTVKVGGGPGTIWSYGQEELSPLTSGLACVGCSVADSALAVDGDSTTASRLIMGIGALGFVGQRVILPGVYQPGDSIVAILGLPADALANAQLLNAIKIKTFNNAITGNPVNNNDSVLLTSGLVRLQVLGVGPGGTRKFRITIPATKTFDAVQVDLGALVGLSSSMNIYEVAAAIPVKVTPSPALTQYNKSVSLVPSIRVPNATYQWFTTPTGGVPIPNAANPFNTPKLTRPATYFVEATDEAGRKSFTRTAVQVKIGGGPGPLWSYGVDTGRATTGGLVCLLCSVENPLLAADGDTTTSARLVQPLGAGSVGQIIKFPGYYKAGDSIILFLSSPSDLLATAQLLGGISVKTHNGTTPGNDPTTLNSSLINLDVLGIGTNNEKKYRVAIPAKKDFDAVEVNLNALLAVDASLRIYEVAASIPVSLAVVPTDTTVDIGQTATFTASIPRIPDATFNWYETPTGGAPIATSNSFTTPPMSAPRTYYVEANSPSDGLISFERTAVTVKVNSLAPSNSMCGQATTTATGVVPICLLCGVTNPNGAVDASQTTFSTLNLTAGVIGSVYQDLIFPYVAPATGKPTDSIRIKIGRPGIIIGAQLLGGITVTTYNGNVSNQDTKPINSPLINLDLLNSSDSLTITFAAGKAFTKVRISLEGGLVGIAANMNIYYARVLAPRATLAVDPVSVCPGEPVTLTAGPDGYNYRWYNTTSTTPIAFGKTYSFTAPNTPGQTTYLVEAVSLNGTDSCASDVKTPVTVITGQQPGVVVTPTSANVAQGATPTFNVVNPSASNRYKWYASPTDTTPVFVGTPFAVPPVTGNITYYVASENLAGTCKSLRTPVQITMTGTGGPNPNPGDIDCGGATTQLSSASGLCVGCFVEKQDSAVDNSTATSSVMHVVLGIIGGYTEQELIFPNVGNAGDSVRIGIGTTTGLVDAGVLTSIQIGSANGTTSNNDMVALNNPLLTVRLLSGNQRGEVSFKPAGRFDRVVVRLNSGLATALSALNVYYAKAFAGLATVENDTVHACAGKPAVLKATGPGTKFRWYNQPTGGQVLSSDSVFTINNVTTNAVYYVEAITGAGCISPARTPVYVIVGLPNVVVVKDIVTVNNGQTATFTVSNPNPAYQYNWYDAPTGGTKVAGPATSFTTPPLTGAKVYYVEAVDVLSGCTSSLRTRVEASINMSPEPTPCSYATGQESPVISGICVLCGVSNPAQAVDTNANSASTITATAGALGFVGQILRFPNVHPVGDSITLDLEVPGQLINAQLLGGIRLQLFNGANPAGNPIFLNNALIRLTLLGSGNRFRVTLPSTQAFNGVLVSINGTISLLTSVKVYFAATITPRPVLSATDFSTCAGKPDTLSVSGPAGADFTWYTTAVGGTPVDTGATFITPALTTTTTYYVASGRFGCENPVRIPVTVNVGGGPAAPTAPGKAICSGEKATLVATAPAGVTFRWYANNTDTIVLARGNSYTTPALTADTAYYVASDNNGCLSSTRTRVPVTVSPLAANFAVTPLTTTVSRGQSATFTASATGTGLIFKWYNAAGDSIFAGASFNTGPLQTAATYTVEAVNPAGCKTQRITVTANVLGSPDNNVPCDVATTQTTAVNGLCIGCFVDNPALAVDSSVGTASSLHVIAGILNGYAQQTLIFPTPSEAGDSVRLSLSFPVGLADLGLLASVQVATYNGATYNDDRISIGNSLISIRLLNGNQQAILAFKPTKVFDRVEVRLNSGVAQLLNAVNVHYASRAIARPQVVADSVAVCAGDSATLQVANPQANVTYKWYNQASGGSPLFTGTTFKTPALSSTFTYYVEGSKTSNGCAGDTRVPVAAIVTPAGNAADIVLSDTTLACGSNAAVLAPTAPSVANPVFKWYLNAARTQPITDQMTSGSVKFALDSLGRLTITGLANGSVTTYYVSVSGSDRCETPAGALKPATVRAVTGGTTPVVTGDVFVTTGQQATLTANPVTGGNIVWYSDATTTTPAGTGTSFVVGPFPAPGTYTFYAAANVGGCESARVPVRVIVSGPNGPGGECTAANSQVTGTTLGCILCSVQNPGYSVDSITNNFARMSVPVGLLGGSVFQQLIFPAAGAAGDSIRLDLATPTGLADVGLFSGTVITVYNNTTVVKRDTLASILTLRILSGQRFSATIGVPAAYDRVEVRMTGAAQLLTSLDIYGAKIQYPAATVNTTNATGCVGKPVTLTVTPPAGTTVNWYADSTSTTVLSNQNSYTTDTLRTAGTVTYYVAVVRNNCASTLRTPVTVKVSAAPAIPPVIADVNVCQGSDAVISVPTPDNTLTYNWYNVATGGTKLNTDSGYTFKVVNVSRDTTFYVEAMNACGAVSARRAVNIKLSTGLTAPTVTPSPDTVFVGQQAVLTATSPAANANYYWFSSATATDTLFKGAVFAAPAQNTPNTVTYWVEAALSGGTACKSVRVPVTVVTEQILQGTVPCEGATTQTTGTSGLGLGNVFNPELAVDNNTNTAASLVLNLGVLNASVWERAKFTGVSAPGDSIRVMLSTANQVLSAALLGSVQLTSYNGNTPGDSILVSNPLIHLQILSGGRRALFTFVPTKPFDAVEVKLKAGIIGALNEIDFNYAQRAMVKPEVAAANVTVCAGNTATLQVQNPVAGITYRWFTNNGVYIAGKDGATFTSGALTKDTAFLVEAFRNGCAGISRARVNVTVQSTPVAPTVQSSNVEVCTGSDAVLAVTNPARGYRYNWYNVATGGTKLNTDSGYTFKVVNVTAPATYYVEAVNDSCNSVSATRTAVSVKTAAGLTVPTVIPAEDFVAINEQPVFTATAATANANFYWFATQTSTDTLFKGAIYAAPAMAVAGTVTYWVEAALPGNTTCKSARVSVKATAVITTPNQVPCEGATTQTNGGSGLGVGSVINPGLSVDNNTNTATSLVLNVGVLNASVWQRAGFNGVSVPGDTVRVLLTNPSQILSAALLGSVKLTTYNGNAPADSVLVSNPLVHINFLNNSKQALISFVPAKPFTAVEVRLRSGIVGALTQIDFNYAQRAIARPKVQVNTANVCPGKPATLSVVDPAPGITYSWYDGQGRLLLDSTAFVTPANLAPGTYSYTVKAGRNNCQSTASVATTVTVQAAPATPVPAGNNPTTTTVNKPVTLNVTPVSGITYNWYGVATGGTPLATNTSSFTTPANLPVGIHNFYVEAVNAGGCGSPVRTKITIEVVGAATARDINVTDQSVCQGDTAVLTPTSTTVTNPVFKWYANPDRTGPITVGVDASGRLTVSGLAPGVYTYYVSVSNATIAENLPGTLKAAKVTVNTRAVAADIIANDTTICVNASVKLTASSTTVTSPVFRWYSDAALQNLVFTGAVYTTPVLTANTTYYVTVSGSNKCANSAATTKLVSVAVRNITAPTVSASAVNICSGDSATLSVQNPVAGVTYRWYNVATGGTVLFTGTVFNTGALTANADFYVEAVAGNCAGTTRTKVSIGVGQAPAPILQSNNVTTCVGGTATFRVTSSTTGLTYRWYNTATGGTALVTGPVFTTTTLNTTTDYYVDATGTGACGKPSVRVKVTATVIPLPTAPTVTSATVRVCIGQTATLTVQSPQSGITYKWYDAATGGSLLFTGTTFNIANVLASADYYVQAVTETSGCNSTTRTKVSVVASAVPATPVVKAASGALCTGQSTTITVQSPDPALTYTWYRTAVGGSPIFTGTTFNTGALDSTTSFYVQANNTSCGSVARAQVTIGVGSAPTPVLESTNVTVCEGNKATLRIISPANNIIYRWYTVATGGTPVFTGTVFTTASLNNTTVYYVEATGTGTCAGTSARIAATVNVVPVPQAPAVQAANVKVCIGQDAILAIQNPQTGTAYQWFDAATGGNLIFTGSVFTVSAVTANADYYVQASVNNGCASNVRTKVSITASTVPTAPTVTAASTTICKGSAATLNVQNPATGIAYRWYTAPSGGTLLFTGASFTTGALNATTDFYVEANNGGCGSAVRTKITIIVGESPTPVLESNNVSICRGSTATLRVTSATNGIVYKWYTTATGGTAIFTGPVFTTAALTNSEDYYVEATAGSGQCATPSVRVKATVTVVTAPGAPTVTAGTIQTCSGQEVSLAVNNPQSGVTYQWYNAATGGNLLFTGPVYTITAAGANTTYYVQAAVGTGCTSATRTPVTVKVDAAPGAPQVKADNITVCINGTATFEVNNPDPAFTYRWYDAPSGGNLLATGPQYTTGKLTLTTTFYLEAVNPAGCKTSRKGVTATVVTTIDAPLADPVTACSGQSAILRVKNPQTATMYRWYTTPSGGTPVFTGANFTTTPLTAGTTFYVDAATSGGCVSASRTPVVVTVNASPAPPVVTNAVVAVCLGQTATLSVRNPDVTLTYRWYTQATGGTAIANGATYTTGAVTANQMYYVEAVNNNDCSSPSRTAVSVTTGNQPGMPTVSGNEDGICPGGTATLRATSTSAGVTFNWYTAPTGGAPIFTGPVFTTPALSVNTTYYVAAATSGGCSSSSRTAVQVNMLRALPAPVVVVDNTTATSVTFRWNPVPGATRYEVTINNGTSFVTPSSGASGTTHTVTGLQPNQSVTLSVRAIGIGTCQTSALSAGVTGKASNPQGNNIFIPNLFSPNNDGSNDVLYVYGTAIAQLEFYIYNQWGQLAFTSRNQRTGWDGTMSGQRQPVGVYVYIVRATMQDGTVITKKGNVTLIR